MVRNMLSWPLALGQHVVGQVQMDSLSGLEEVAEELVTPDDSVVEQLLVVQMMNLQLEPVAMVPKMLMEMYPVAGALKELMAPRGKTSVAEL